MNAHFVRSASLVVLAMVLVFALVGCSCSRQDGSASSSSADGASSVMVDTGASSSSSEEAGAAMSLGEEDTASGGASGGKETGSDAGSYVDPSPERPVVPEPSPAPDPSPVAPEPAPSVHEHSWVWVPNWVTVVDQEAWDEPVYVWVDWCPTCGCQVPYTHTEDTALSTGMGHSTTERQVIDHYDHHDAITHEEDHGAYQCDQCGAWQ